MLGANLRKARIRRGLSIERLAQVAGISRAMISQIELGKSSPTINVLSKLSSALGLPFTGLLASPARVSATIVRRSRSTSSTSENGQLRSRALFPAEAARAAELYELELAGTESSPAHPPGTWENLVVALGFVEVEVGGVVHRLAPGDSMLFAADVPHVYRTPEATTAVLYLVMMYREPEP